MGTSSLSELGPIPSEVLHVLLIKLIRDQGGAVTVDVRELVDQTGAAWRIAVRRGPGRGETTWTAERIEAPDHG